MKKGLCDGWKAKGFSLDLAAGFFKMGPEGKLLSKLDQWNVKEEIQD
jgi:hypothetical protein